MKRYFIDIDNIPKINHRFVNDMDFFPKFFSSYIDEMDNFELHQLQLQSYYYMNFFYRR
jgi:hypothetical protein